MGETEGWLEEGHLNRGGGRSILNFDQTPRRVLRSFLFKSSRRSQSIFRLQTTEFAQLCGAQCFVSPQFVPLQIIAFEHDQLDRVLHVTERELRVSVAGPMEQFLDESKPVSIPRKPC